MPYDEKLADRIRELLAGGRGVTATPQLEYADGARASSRARPGVAALNAATIRYDVT